MRPRTKPPIESYGPELMAALIAGSTKEFKFELRFGDCVKFRRRIHQLRTRMREEKHPQANLVERARVQILWGKAAREANGGVGFTTEPSLKQNSNNYRTPSDPNTPALILIKPYDSEFADALSRAGLKIDTEVGTDLSLPTHDPNDPLAAFDPARHEPEGG